MIYDHVLTVFELDAESSPLKRRLINGADYYYGEREVYSSRYFAAMQANARIDMMVEINLSADERRIPPDSYCVPADGQVYRVIQAQYGLNDDGLPVTWLSLQVPEGKYEILRS